MTTIPSVAPAVSCDAQRQDDVVCFSHLRWNFVYQRPQHLLTRFARDRRVFYFEEPLFDASEPRLEVHVDAGVTVVTPHLPDGRPASEIIELQRRQLDGLLVSERIVHPIGWYYTPMALEFSKGLDAAAIVFDCMDELSAFAGAPAGLVSLERELLDRADVVFTGGQSLFESKRKKHPHVRLFASSVDCAHFGRARMPHQDPPDQAEIPRPRVGFFGVVDERMDLQLLAGLARLRPDWHQIIIGPVVKIEPASLPRAANIHYLGMKSYNELPAYLAGWDVAFLPFARNDATRFISPTKTPEYLAAGRPVVSTSIADVVRPYGESGLVTIADAPADFACALDAALDASGEDWLRRVDDYLSHLSWDRTFAAMNQIINVAAGNAPVHRRRPGESEQIPQSAGDSYVRLPDHRSEIRW
jgi:glycosyltransferase involved in cell wall biosynthesis